MQPDSRPPALPPVLNILVAGHREDRLQESQADLPAIVAALRTTIERIEIAADLAFATAPYARGVRRTIRLITGSADGIDALAAEFAAARPERYQVKRVPPLTQRHCAADDCPAWLAEHAVALRDEVAIAHADVVLAVWDGESARGFQGGTVRIIQQAVLAGRPVVWIGMDGRCRLLGRDGLTAPMLLSLRTLEADPSMLAALFAELDPEKLARQIRELLAPGALFGAAAGRTNSVQAVVAGYFRPRAAGWRDRHAGALDALFTALASANFRKARQAARRLLVPADDPPWIGPDWPAGLAPPVALPTFFAWSDHEANVAAGKRRSSVWVIALCSVLAVLLSALGVVVDQAFGPESAPWLPVLEFVPIAATVALFAMHRLQRVHQYWLFHRWFAEQLRFQRLVMPLDGLHPAMLRSIWTIRPEAARPQSGGHNPPLGMHELEAQDWLLQRVLAAEDFDYAGELGADTSFEAWTNMAAAFTADGLLDQEHYHEGKAATFHLLHRNLDWLAIGSFIVTGAAVLLHLFAKLEWTFVLTTALPTAGAALTGVVDQLEAARIADQSERAAAALADYRAALTGIVGRHIVDRPWRAVWKFIEARRIGQDAVRLMAGETDDWRSVLNYREFPRLA